MKTKYWILIFAVVMVVCVLICVIMYSHADGKIANVYLDGELIRSINLDTVTQAYEFTVECGDGVNTIRVERGRICVVYADCPDKVCVDTGWISDSAMPIVCLPHRLVITFESDNEDFDTFTGQ